MKRSVLLLHTGGTLGMEGTPLEPGAFNEQLVDRVPELNQIASVEPRIVCNLDSSDVGPGVWSKLAEVIGAEHANYDGFVIIHGTDTMAYTAGALAFALEGLQKPVVLTGAQRPLAAHRSDARRNLADAVDIATCDIPEVGICFDGLFLRGCRAVKNDVRSYRGFASPGVEPLARLGTDINISNHVRRPARPFCADARFDPRVDVVYVTPGLQPNTLVRRFADPNLKGVVLAAFGVGTVPTRDRNLAPAVAEAVARGVDVLVVTQWGGGVELDRYKNSLGLAEAGALSGGNMRIEAAVPKLMHALALHQNARIRRNYLLWNIAGER